MRKKQARFMSMFLAIVFMINTVVTSAPGVFAAVVTASKTYGTGETVSGVTSNNAQAMSFGADKYLLTDGFDVTVKFENTPFLTSTNWYHNFLFQIYEGKEYLDDTGDGKGIVFRADRFGFTYNYGNAGTANLPIYAATITWNWDNFVSMCQSNTNITLNLRKITDYVIIATVTFSGTTADEMMVYTVTYPQGVPETLWLKLGSEGGKINIKECTYNTPSYSYKTKKDNFTAIGYQANGGVGTSFDEFTGDFSVSYSFNNKSTGTLNWDNFLIQVTNNNGFDLVARADAYDLAGPRNENGDQTAALFAWENDIWTIEKDRWPDFANDMRADAKVYATIERTGNLISFGYNIIGKTGSYNIGGKYTYASNALPNTLQVRLTGENVEVSNITAVIRHKGDGNYDASKDSYIEYGAETTKVSVHDPSIVKGHDDTYYIFGSHLAWAKSKDLITWQTFENNINRNFETLFAEEAKWSARGGNSDGVDYYNLSGNLWAPDVIWNETMNKWCMYMSVNGKTFYTTVVLLTAENIEGPYTYKGTVVYSGFQNNSEAMMTDYERATGKTTLPDDRYTKGRNNNTNNRLYGMNAIDPCVTYDGEGENKKLWMTYGSWFGGIYMLELDQTTGFRDYTHKYNDDYTEDQTTYREDPYQGIRIAGGNHVSGEASYIEKIGDYWYLFMSYGGLSAYSVNPINGDEKSGNGYNMRVFRSEEIDGEYFDSSGDPAIFDTYSDNVNGSIGNRLMSYYQWNYPEFGWGQVAQGHNSAFVDDNGKKYVIYHTRFKNEGRYEFHEVRVHQLFLNADGWIVTAPFEYRGEELSDKGFTAKEIAGNYEVLYHKNSVNHSASVVECVTGETVTFGKDKTLSGTWNGAAIQNGSTWAADETSPYVTLTVNGKEYKGVFIEQQMEGLNEKTTLCFTVLGSADSADAGISVWGYRYPYEGMEFIENAINEFNILGTFSQNITLPSASSAGVKITWESLNTDIISNDGKIVKTPSEDTVVTMRATFTYGEGEEQVSDTHDYPIRVFSDKNSKTQDKYLIWECFTGKDTDQTGGAKNLTNVGEGDIRYPNPFSGDHVLGIPIYNGVSIEFEASREGAMVLLSNIISIRDAGHVGLYFTGGSYLGYNIGADWFDANVDNAAWQPVTDYIGIDPANTKVQIDLKPTGFKVTINGESYTDEDIGSKAKGGSSANFDYASVLTYLRNVATDLNFGWGSHWSGGFNGSIKNIAFYAYPPDYIDKEPYDVYYEDYNSRADTGWTSPTVPGHLSVDNDGDSRGGYVSFASTDSIGGDRGAYMNFFTNDDAKPSENYIVEADIKFKPGNYTNSHSQFAITGPDDKYDTGSTASPYNHGIVSGYILKLNATGSGATTYYINDSDDKTVTIPAEQWVHIKVIVKDKDNIKGEIKIGDETHPFETTATASDLKGLYLLRGRGTGAAYIDNITVATFHYDDPVFEWTQGNGTWTATATFVCNNAGEQFNETMDAKVDVEEVPPTCNSDGTKTYTASVEFNGKTYTCKEQKVDRIPSEGADHKSGEPFTDPDSIKAATCTEDGTHDVITVCTVCGEVLTRETVVDEKAFGHNYKHVFKWSDDYKTADVVFTCENDPTHTEEKPATIKAETVEPTCTEDGYITYTATVEFNNKTYTDTKKVNGEPKTGHKYADYPDGYVDEDGKRFEWSKDENDVWKAAATFTCLNECGLKHEATAIVEQGETVAPTCVEDGYTVYTATVEFNGKTYTDTVKAEGEKATGHKLVEIIKGDAKCGETTVYKVYEHCTVPGCGYEEFLREEEGEMPHSYSEPDSCQWADDGSSVTAIFICSNCGEGKEEKTINEVTITTVDVTCTTDGKTTYSADIEFKGNTYHVTKDVNIIAALGHKYGENEEPEFKWSDDGFGGKTANAVFTCENECGTQRVEKAEVEKEEVPATCEKDGSTIYTATAELNNKTYTAELEVPDEGSKLGHSYTVPEFTWTDNNTKATVVFHCANDEEHTTGSMDVDEVTVNRTEPTCQEDGEITYTAVITYEGEKYSETKTETIESKGDEHISSDPFTDEASVKAATCTEKATHDVITVCTVCGTELTRETVEDGDKLGHDYNKHEFKWAADYKSATVVFTCKNDSTHTVEQAATVTSKTVDPTCEVSGNTTYTATVTFENETYTDTKTVTITATGHVDADNDGKCDVCGKCLHQHDSSGKCTEDNCKHDDDCCPKSQAPVTSSEPAVTSSEPAVTSSEPAVTSSEPVTSATATQPPVTQPPVTQPPTTQAPSTTTQPPVTTTQPPATSAPTTTVPDVTVAVTIAPEAVKNVEQNVKKSDDAPNVEIPIKIEELANKVLNNEEKAAAESGDRVEIVLNVEVKEISVPEDASAPEYAAVMEIISAVEQIAATNNYVVGQYLELDLNVYINDEISRAVTVTDEPISITIDIPDDLFAEGREYVIIREHDGETVILKDQDNDPNTITFETDRFSTYAIGYSDHENDEIPNTGNGLDMAVRISVMFLSAALIGTLYIKRKRSV